MATISPLRNLQEQAEAEFMVHGRRDPGSAADVAAEGIEIVSTYGEVEAEYASLRRSAALMDLPQLGILRVTGADRVDFLNRMLTNELKGLAAGQVVHAFWLNRKGRIEADLSVIELGDEMLLIVDATLAQRTADSLSGFLFSEDVAIENLTGGRHVLSLHGPRAIEFLRSVVEEPQAASLSDLTPGRAMRCTVHGHPVVVYRSDQIREVGLHLICPVDEVVAVHEQLLEIGLGQGLRSIGWYAFNIARIEGGCPMHLIDFGLDSLPHETGILRQRVSFTKGCYLGQEVVARMESLGHPSKVLVGLKIEGEHMPVTGSQVFEPADQIAEVVGAVTSATPSPMLGRTIIAFAMVKHSKTGLGTEVIVSAEGQRARAVVHDLKFWPRETPRES
ncbi:MAG: aminomethyltransferase family protein [Phycisphaerales bacterium]|nr:aminomethyltransferase family protein [Phycisphaerales bacterium]